MKVALTIKPLIILVLSFISCSKAQNNTATVNSLDLLRGDIALCGVQDFGQVNFSLSCNYEVKETSDLAVSLLHSFEYDDAEKVFAKVIDMDPNCAMAYWGVAMSIYHSLWDPPNKANLEEASKILRIAESLPKTIREQAYLDAIGAYYKDWEHLTHTTRALKLEKAMEKVYLTYQNDTEAAVFYALTLNSTELNDLH